VNPFRLFSRLLRPVDRLDKSELEVERILGHRFRNPPLLRHALTHRSFLAESGAGPGEANERLELLGDAVLDLIVVEGLWKSFPHLQEGDLSKLKSMLVSGQALNAVARELHIGDHILMSESEARNGGRTRGSILEDAFEALVAALYLDGGMDAAKGFVNRVILSRANGLASAGVDINYKSQLLEFAQGRGLSAPHYHVLKEKGPDHQKEFDIEVYLDGRPVGRGFGASKKSAQQMAARDAMGHLAES